MLETALRHALLIAPRRARPIQWPAAPRGALAAIVVAITAALAACGPSPPDGPGACKARLLPGDLVITEVFADFKATPGSAGTDTGKEWFEIYNTRSAPIDLEGLTITHSRPDGSKPSTHVVGPATIAPGQYYTLGNAAQAQVPAYVDYGYGADLGELYNTGGGKLALACGDREIDSAAYDGVTEGHARELSSARLPEYTFNDAPASWCQATASEFETGNFGTPGSDNDCRPLVVGQCNDRGAMRDAVAPGPGDLVITEVMPSPSQASDTTGEWFEAKVIRDVDLNGVAIDRAGDTARPDVITATECVHARAGSYVVFAKSADPAVNGGIPAAAIAGTFKLALVAGSPGAPGDVALLAGDTVIDAVRWTRSTTGKSLQLDPDRVDPTANDTEGNFCDATLPYGPGPMSDLGTPGGDNTRCPQLPAAGTCLGVAGLRSIVTPAPGQLVISEVLANPARPPGGASADAQREWFEVTNTGATAFDLNELRVGRIGAPGTAVQSARCISVAARGFAVFARSNDPAVNGMLPQVDATFSFTLVDTGGDVQIAHGGDVLDAASWKSVKEGVSRQLDPAHLTTADNDDHDASRPWFCAGAAPYGDLSNQGTPGAANTRCPSP